MASLGRRPDTRQRPVSAPNDEPAAAAAAAAESEDEAQVLDEVGPVKSLGSDLPDIPESSSDSSDSSDSSESGQDSEREASLSANQLQQEDMKSISAPQTRSRKTYRQDAAILNEAVFGRLSDRVVASSAPSEPSKSQRSNSENLQPSVAKRTAPASGKLKKIKGQTVPIRAMGADEPPTPFVPEAPETTASQSRNTGKDQQNSTGITTQRRTRAMGKYDRPVDISSIDAAAPQRRSTRKTPSQHNGASMERPENNRQGSPLNDTKERYSLRKGPITVAEDEHEIDAPPAVAEDAEDAATRPRKRLRRVAKEKAPSKIQLHPRVVISHSKDQETARSGRRAPSRESRHASNAVGSKLPSIQEQPTEVEDEDHEGDKRDTNHYVFPDDDGDVSASTDMQLYGQKAVIKKIWISKKATIIRIRRDNELRMRSDFAKVISARCKQLLSALKDDNQDLDDSISLVQEEVANIGTALQNLDFENGEERSHHLFENIYVFVIPNLFGILIDMVDAFTYGRDEHDQDVDPNALRIIVDHVKYTCQFYQRVRATKVTPSPGLGIVKPIMNMIAPLKDVHRILKIRLEHEQIRERRALEQAKRDRVQRQKQAEEAHRQEEERKIKETEWDWTSLDNNRLLHEPDDFRRQQLRERFKPVHSLFPNASGIDANGRRFDRVDVFDARRERSARTSPPLDPSEWSLDQIEALLECIDIYGQAAPRADSEEDYRYSFYNHIIRNYCGAQCSERRSKSYYKREGPLRPFTLFEIAEKLLYFRNVDLLSPDQAEKIPVW